ncbi:adaptin family protein [Artemisia annua]|uniref:Adaptin family protein n=1 Tax=Artemisia annua TaxID=35608 RepID=A0A2U1KGA9_ARTAN|nr:adaptin family protein [Artemisia annua]
MPTLHVVEPSPIIITSSSIVQLCPLINPASSTGPPLHVVLSASAGQGLQISAQLICRDGSGTSENTLVPIVMFQNIARGPPNSLLQVAIKNNQQPVWYFTDKVSMLVLFKEDGKMEHGTFLETWRSLPDSKEVSKDISDIVINSVDETIERLASSNIFFIAKRKNEHQHVLYISAKVHNRLPFLMELTLILGSPGIKCAIKSPKPDMATLVFEALKTLLRS